MMKTHLTAASDGAYHFESEVNHDTYVAAVELLSAPLADCGAAVEGAGAHSQSKFGIVPAAHYEGLTDELLAVAAALAATMDYGCQFVEHTGKAVATA